MNKYLQRSLVIILIILLSLIPINYISYLTRPVDADQCKRNIEAFHSIPDNSVEVMIYGSSHGWRGVNNLEMYDRYGIGSYNYCGNWQNISTEELFFYDSLRTQKPKVVLIETYMVSNTLYDVDMNGEIYYTRVMPRFDMKKEYLRRAFAGDYKRYFTYLFPFAQFHSEWNRLQPNSFVNFYTKDEFVNTMGYGIMPYDGLKVYESEIPDPSTFTQIEIDEKAIGVLDEIVATCKENDIKVIFFTIPWQTEYLFGDAMKEYVRENDCVYLDFYELADEVGLDGATDFIDLGHLNNSGATKIGAYLGKYLTENYDLTDMRKIENNLWEGKNGNLTGYKWLEYNKDKLNK